MAVRMYSEMVTLQTMDSIFFWYRGKEEFPSTSPQWEKKQLTLHQQLRFLLMIYLASGLLLPQGIEIPSCFFSNSTHFYILLCYNFCYCGSLETK